MKTILLLISVFAISYSFAQKNSTTLTYVNAEAKVKKYHTKPELEKMGKLELTELYMERVGVLTELLPYIALHTKPGATLRDMGIPETKQNLDHLDKEVKNKGTYLAAVNETLDDIIPYADTKNIVWSIMFYEEMIRLAEAGEGDIPSHSNTLPSRQTAPPSLTGSGSAE